MWQNGDIENKVKTQLYQR